MVVAGACLVLGVLAVGVTCVCVCVCVNALPFFQLARFTHTYEEALRLHHRGQAGSDKVRAHVVAVVTAEWWPWWWWQYWRWGTVVAVLRPPIHTWVPSALQARPACAPMHVV